MPHVALHSRMVIIPPPNNLQIQLHPQNLKCATRSDHSGAIGLYGKLPSEDKGAIFVTTYGMGQTDIF